MVTINRTSDPTADWDAYCEACDEEYARMIASAPKCDECGKSVAECDSEYCYDFDGWTLCCDCVHKHMICIPYHD